MSSESGQLFPRPLPQQLALPKLKQQEFEFLKRPATSKKEIYVTLKFPSKRMAELIELQFLILLSSQELKREQR